MSEMHIEGDNNVIGSNIQASGDVMVGGKKTTNIYLNANYQELTERIAELEEDLAEIPLKKLERRLKKSGKLEALRKRETEFRQEIIRLAETFTRIPINTERLKQAKALFEQGKFKEADTLLAFEDLKGDQENFVAARARNEQKKQEIDTAFETNANEFLVKAQTTALNYTNPKRFEETCRYFEASIVSLENQENLFAFASFLLGHNQNQGALSRFERHLYLFRKVATQSQIADVLDSVGILNEKLNKPELADLNYQKALVIWRRLANSNPVAYLPSLASTLNNLGILHWKNKSYEYAEGIYQEALEIYRKLNIAYNNQYESKVALTLNNLGNLYATLKRHELAERYYEDGFKTFQKLAEINPDKYSPEVIKTLNNMGVLQINRNQYARALKPFEECLKFLHKAVETNPLVYLPNLAAAYSNIGVARWRLGEFSQAEENYQKALDIYRKLAHSNSESYLADVARTLHNIGALQTDQSKFPQAETSYQEAVEVRRKLAQGNPQKYLSDLANTLINWADLNQKINNRVSFTQIQEGLKIILPFVAHIPSAQDSATRAFNVLRAWKVDPASFLEEHNLPLELLSYQS